MGVHPSKAKLRIVESLIDVIGSIEYDALSYTTFATQSFLLGCSVCITFLLTLRLMCQVGLRR